MDKCYKLASTLMLSICAVMQVNGQTHYGAGAGGFGTAHAFFGTNTGKVNLGADNTFIGHEAGALNLGGDANTFVGKQAGFFNLEGVNNTMIGQHAGRESSGDHNTFLGTVAGFSSSASYNTYLGAYAGSDNQNGQSNVFVGAYAGENSVAASFNAILGYGAFDSGEGDNNCIIGRSSGSQNKGNSNVFLGAQTGFLNRGDENTFIGFNAGHTNKEGFFNIFLGAQSGYSSQTGVGNVFLGNKSGYSNTNGHQNVFLGYGAGYHNTTGQRNTYLGYGATGNATLENATAVGSEAKVTANNSIVLGKNANVGIGTSAPSFQLHLSTDAAAKAGSPNWIVASDHRLKKNVTNFTDGLNLLKQIHPVWFQYNGKAGIETGDKMFVGIIAQEMQKIAPYTIGAFTHQDSLGNKTEYLGYDANAVTYILINAVKEVVEQKDAELKVVNEQVSELSKRLEQLERIIADNTVKSLTGSTARMEQNENGVVLEQNAPNGFSGSTSIRYYIPKSAKVASLNIYNTKGMKVGMHDITGRGPGELTLSAEHLERGVLLYELVIDGESAGKKKMLIE